MNAATTWILDTGATLKNHCNDMENHIKLLEDKLLNQIEALKSPLFNYIFDLRKDILLLKENNEKEKPTDLNDEKDKVL